MKMNEDEVRLLGIDFGMMIAKHLQVVLIDEINENLRLLAQAQEEGTDGTPEQEDWQMFFDRVELLEVDFDTDEVIDEELGGLCFVWTVAYTIDGGQFFTVIPFASASLNDLPCAAAEDICSVYAEQYGCCV